MKITNKHVGHALWIIPHLFLLKPIVHWAHCGEDCCFLGLLAVAYVGLMATVLGVYTILSLLDGDIKFEINIPIKKWMAYFREGWSNEMTREERELFEEWLRERDKPFDDIKDEIIP